jgi:hypothetical protein
LHVIGGEWRWTGRMKKWRSNEYDTARGLRKDVHKAQDASTPSWLYVRKSRRSVVMRTSLWVESVDLQSPMRLKEWMQAAFNGSLKGGEGRRDNRSCSRYRRVNQELSIFFPYAEDVELDERDVR